MIQYLTQVWLTIQASNQIIHILFQPITQRQCFLRLGNNAFCSARGGEDVQITTSLLSIGDKLYISSLLLLYVSQQQLFVFPLL